MKNPNLDEIADIIANVAETEVMPRFRNLSVSDIATKTSADDLVTTADTETEKVLTAAGLQPRDKRKQRRGWI